MDVVSNPSVLECDHSLILFVLTGISRGIVLNTSWHMMGGMQAKYLCTLQRAIEETPGWRASAAAPHPPLVEAIAEVGAWMWAEERRTIKVISVVLLGFIHCFPTATSFTQRYKIPSCLSRAALSPFQGQELFQ